MINHIRNDFHFYNLSKHFEFVKHMEYYETRIFTVNRLKTKMINQDLSMIGKTWILSFTWTLGRRRCDVDEVKGYAFWHFDVFPTQQHQHYETKLQHKHNIVATKPDGCDEMVGLSFQPKVKFYNNHHMVLYMIYSQE